MRTKQNFAARVTGLMHIPDIFADEVANDRGVDVADQVSGKNEATVQSHNHIQAPAGALA